PGNFWRVGALGLIIADLFSFDMLLNPTTDARLYTAASPEAVVALRKTAGLDRTYVTEADYQESLGRFFNFRVFSSNALKDVWQVREALAPNLATAEHIYEAYNFDPIRLERPHRLQEAAEAQGTADRLLDIMGVRFLVTNQRDGEGRKVWGESGPATVYEREPGLPRAFIVPEAIRVSGEAAALARVASPDFDPRSQVVLEAPEQLLLPSGHASGEVRIVDYSPQRVSLEVESAGGVLVLADAYYPGWKARVDTAQVPVWPANAAFRGIIMPAGTHQVEFWYEPGTFKVGAAISLLALLAVMLLAGYGFWSLRRAD
ncbi:MAG TPA: YfhO family protein, partial [Candidatus Glassbacteria bacterium]|nr:YfhO family protein [Candidatus Glassbacteria bacterium]